MSENRQARLAADYREMLKIQDQPYLSWIVTKGEPPCAEEYLLTVNVRTYALAAAADRYVVGAIHQCTVRVTLWDSYPHTAPYIKMLNIPPAFHPDWYSKGTYCASKPWHTEDSLKDYVKRMIATLQYTPQIMETNAPANYKALDWFNRNRENGGMFPSDTTALTENSTEEVAALEKGAGGFGEIIDDWKR